MSLGATEGVEKASFGRLSAYRAYCTEVAGSDRVARLPEGAAGAASAAARPGGGTAIDGFANHGSAHLAAGLEEGGFVCLVGGLGTSPGPRLRLVDQLDRLLPALIEA